MMDKLPTKHHVLPSQRVKIDGDETICCPFIRSHIESISRFKNYSYSISVLLCLEEALCIKYNQTPMRPSLGLRGAWTSYFSVLSCRFQCFKDAVKPQCKQTVC